MIKTEQYVLNMGPSHPSTHGVLQVILELDGERIVKATPKIGYLHRGIEKLLESRTYTQAIPYTDRLDYVAGMNNEYAYCQTVEKLAGIEVPRRAQYLRVIVAELSRIASHLVFAGTLATDLGSATGLIYAFRDREKVLDLFSIISGARMTYNYMRIGGVKADAQPEFIRKTYEFLAMVPDFLKEYHDFLSGNEIFQHRLQGVSVLSTEEALNLGMTGSNLRATGMPYDLRKIDGGIYDEFDFDVPVGKNGDNYDRWMVRINEIAESAKIVRQALDGLPEGPYMAKVPKILRPPKGEAYHRTENPRGVLGFYIVSDGSTKPYRVHIRRPSLANLQGLDAMCRNMLLADSVAVYSAIDPLMGEVDC